ncbi:hypothetical protein HaLaN_01060, partial [Haematococcus lacustris]
MPAQAIVDTSQLLTVDYSSARSRSCPPHPTLHQGDDEWSWTLPCCLSDLHPRHISPHLA